MNMTWNDENDKIMEIIDALGKQKDVFPIKCPICGKTAGHIYMHRHDEEHGGIWVWCSHCRSYAHMSGTIPSSWKNAPFIDEECLSADPIVLDKNAASIDEWVNKLGDISFPHSSEETCKIQPYWGFGLINLKMSFSDIQTILNAEGLDFFIEKAPLEHAMEVSQDIIWVGNSISMFFVNGTMYKICFSNSFPGAMDNGISIGTSVQEAQRIDSSLKHGDNQNLLISDNGYHLAFSDETGKITSIIVYIKEAENGELFYSFKWCEGEKIND